MRFCFAPLYIRYLAVWDAVDHLSNILNSGAWKDSKYHERPAVTLSQFAKLKGVAKPMSKIESLSSRNLPAPRFRYSPLIKSGPIYQTAGMIALDSDSGELEPGGAGAETAKILANLLAAMPDFGLELGDLVKVTIYTTQFDQFADINAAWEAVIDADRPPARTSIGVSALPIGVSVEMEFEFYRD